MGFRVKFYPGVVSANPLFTVPIGFDSTLIFLPDFRAKTVSENVKLNPALLSRFDLVFILLDKPDTLIDTLLSGSIFLSIIILFTRKL